MHTERRPAGLERKCFTHLDREIRLARHLLRLAALSAFLVSRGAPGRTKRMSCEDYDEEEPMEIEAEVRAVLDIVCRILRDRTDWIAQGQVLMEEIVAEVRNTGPGRANRTLSPAAGYPIPPAS
jgi:hypothetical protein